MKAIADFASSDAGKAFARIEQHYGRDPGAALEPIDDVLAHNLRAALIVTLAEEAPDDEHADAVSRTQQAAAKIKERLSA